MNAFVTAVLMGAALLAVAIWVEVRERRAARVTEVTEAPGRALEPASNVGSLLMTIKQ